MGPSSGVLVEDTTVNFDGAYIWVTMCGATFVNTIEGTTFSYPAWIFGSYVEVPNLER